MDDLCVLLDNSNVCSVSRWRERVHRRLLSLSHHCLAGCESSVYADVAAVPRLFAVCAERIGTYYYEAVRRGVIAAMRMIEHGDLFRAAEHAARLADWLPADSASLLVIELDTARTTLRCASLNLGDVKGACTPPSAHAMAVRSARSLVKRLRTILVDCEDVESIDAVLHALAPLTRGETAEDHSALILCLIDLYDAASRAHPGDVWIARTYGSFYTANAAIDR